MPNVFASEQPSLSDKTAAQNIVVFISHPQNLSITLSDTKRLYTLSRKLLPNGNSATLAILPLKNKVSVKAFRFLLGLYPYQAQRTWDRAVFSGKGSAPTVFETSSAIIEHVKVNEGSIGYVMVSDAAALKELKEVVNVIAIIE